MSWSFGAVVRPGEDVGVALDLAYDNLPESQRDLLDAAEPQVARARAAAAALWSAVCRDGDGASISMSGHYNVDKEPMPEWDDCAIYVSVMQVPVEKIFPPIDA